MFDRTAPFLFGCFWIFSLCACEPSGSYSLHLVFPDDEARQLVSDVELWALNAGGYTCEQLMTHQVHLADLTVYSRQLFGYPSSGQALLAAVPARSLLFYAEGRMGSSVVLGGCTPAQIKSNAKLDLTMDLVWSCHPNPSGERVRNGIDDDCDAMTDECVSSKDCNDDNPCTQDLCLDQQCQNPEFPNGLTCSIDDLCLLNSSCAGGQCVGTSKDCRALDTPCRKGVCAPQTGECIAQLKEDGTPCDDNDPCTDPDACNLGTCVGKVKKCDDQDDCTIDWCDPASGLCQQRLDPKPGMEGPAGDASCSDQQDNDCDQLTDDLDPDCKPCNQPTDCEDGIFCTAHDCIDFKCVISNQPENTLCDDSIPCTEGDVCHLGVCSGSRKDCSSFSDACHNGFCRPGDGMCFAQALAEGTPCNDGLFCSDGDQCDNLGTCHGIVSHDCSDNDRCTQDTCNEQTNLCEHVPFVPGTEGPAGDPSCQNGVDDNCDGLTDQEDPRCTCPVQVQNLSGIDCEVPAGCDAPPICSGLMLLLHFNRLTESGESDTLAHDFSGHNNQASCSSPDCPTWLQDGGMFNGAYSFSNNGNSRFVIPASDSLSCNAAVTISVWFNPSSFPTNHSPIAAKYDVVSGSANYWLGLNSNKFELWYRVAGNWIGRTSTQTFTLGQPYHLVGIFDNDRDLYTLFVDGQKIIEFTDSRDMVVDSSDLWIGKDQDLGHVGVDGVIDDLAIWNRALSQQEIDSLYP